MAVLQSFYYYYFHIKVISWALWNVRTIIFKMHRLLGASKIRILKNRLLTKIEKIFVPSNCITVLFTKYERGKFEVATLDGTHRVANWAPSKSHLTVKIPRPMMTLKTITHHTRPAVDYDLMLSTYFFNTSLFSRSNGCYWIVLLQIVFL